MIHNIQRLLFIEAVLIVHKRLVRRDITATFFVGPATATRDISEYRHLNKGNLILTTTPRKAWIGSETFEPVLFTDLEIISIEEQAKRYLKAFQSVIIAVSSCRALNPFYET